MHYELSFTSRILDNVHGLIRLTPVERAIIDTPVFRRLLSIKQLSLINRVFPGSGHTRFSHSLGVMHIADKIAMKLNFGPIDRQVIRLAGLLHDIGHYPLSHVCESAYIDDVTPRMSLHELNNDVLNTINIFDPYYLEPDKYMSRQNKPYHHENIGAEIIKNNSSIRDILYNYMGSSFDILDLCDIITGNVERNKKLSIKVQIIHSELDADGLDYLLRDSKFSGTSFGQIELEYLIDNFCIAKYKDHEILAVDPKGIAAADQYLIAKFYAYTRVVYNRRASIIDYIAEKIVIWSFTKGFPGEGFPTGVDILLMIKDNNDTYIHFTDDYLWGKFSKYYDDKHIPALLKKFIYLLIFYQEPIQKFELSIITTSRKDMLKKVLNSVPYNELLSGCYIPLLKYRKMTKHVPTKDIYKWFNKMKKGEESTSEDEKIFNKDYLDFILTRRYQDAIVVYDSQRKGKKINLLCDDDRSLMRYMHNITCIILREYSCPSI